jgi:hypothetical protein
MLRLGWAGRVVALGAIVLTASCKHEDHELPHFVGLFPQIAYTGFNPNADFRVMFVTNILEPDLEWTVGDPALATLEPSETPTIKGVDAKDLRFVVVKTKKVGKTTVSVRSGETTLKVDLEIRNYTDEQLRVGKARYETGTTSDPARPPCASCHAKPEGIDHSPLRMAGFDDETILGVIQRATYPESPRGQSTTSAFAPTGPLQFTGHKWNLHDDEKDGILAYLRSLPLGGRRSSADAGTAAEPRP